MCVTAAVCFFFFWWCFSTDFYSNFSSVVKLSVAALVRVNDTDRKQSACCHSTVAPRQPTTSGQRDGRASGTKRKKERKKERKKVFLPSFTVVKYCSFNWGTAAFSFDPTGPAGIHGCSIETDWCVSPAFNLWWGFYCSTGCVSGKSLLNKCCIFEMHRIMGTSGPSIYCCLGSCVFTCVRLLLLLLVWFVSSAA